MKRITLLLLLFLLTGSVAYSQIPQDFEGGIPTGWTRYNNAFGAAQWATINAVTTPPTVCEGTISAFVNGRENIGVGNTSEKWLVSSLATVPANGQLVFSTRSTINGFDNTTYQVRVSTVSQNSGFQIVAQWTEEELTQVFNICEEKTVDLSVAGYAGQDVYIAFVMLVTQPTATPTGDRWIIDDIRLVERCINPEDIEVGGISQVGATITWDNPGGAELFEVEIVEFPNTPIGVGVEVGPETTYSTTTLNESTQYAVYVRAKCSESNSEWVGPVNFTTSSPGLTCDSAIPIDEGLPYSTTDNTSNYSDDIDGSPGTGCGAAGNFLNGNNVYYSYTADFDGVVNITMTPTGNNSGIFVYNSCNNVGVSCIAGASGTDGAPRVIDLPVVNGQTYYIVISTSGTPSTIAYGLTIQKVNCPPPTNLEAVGGQSSAILNWDENGATSWEYVVQTAGSAIPSGAGIQTNSFENITVTELFDTTPIAASTLYQYWVRRDCGDGTFSAWAGPLVFNTTVCDVEDVCNYTFRLIDRNSDGWDGALMQVRQNGIVVATLGTGFTSGGGPIDVIVPLCDGLPFDLFWNISGSWANEVRVEVINDSGQVVHVTPFNSAGLAGTVLYTDSLVQCGVPECLAPTGLATVAGQVSDTSAEVRWDIVTGITEYEVIWLPSPSTAPTGASTGTLTSENPFLIPDLEAGTIYDVYIRAICPEGISPWTSALTFTTAICAVEDQCNYTFKLSDQFDSWNGASMQVRQNGIVVATLSMPTTADVDIVVPLCNGLPFDLFWNTAGGWPDEVIVQILNDSNQIVHLTDIDSGDLAGTILYTDSLVECGVIECLPPSGIAINDIEPTTATVTWTAVPDVEEYHVIYLPCTAPAPTDTATGWFSTDTNSLPVSDLNPDTCYRFYVRLICANGNVSGWSQGVNATTAQVPPACGGTFTDVGGSAGQYLNNLDYTITICPDSTEDIVTVLFNSFNLENGWDALYVYDGDSTSAPQFNSGLGNGFGPNANLTGGYWGTTIPGPFESSTPGGCLTFRFISDSSGVRDGWAANVICGPGPACDKPTDFNICPVSTGGLFNWVPGSDETSWEVAVLPVGSPIPADGEVVLINNFEVGGLLENTEYTLFVRAVCANGEGYSSWVLTPFETEENNVLEANPFCATTADNAIIFDNVFGLGSNSGYGQVACLGSTPNPVWYYLQVDEPGDLFYSLVQNTQFTNGVPTGTGLDVDFVAFGPFGSLADACGNVELVDCPTCPNNTGNPNFYPFGNIVDCSYDPDFIETLTIENAQAGQVYAILITNFENDQGQILLQELPTSTGSTNCDAQVTLGNDKFICADSTEITATVANPSGTAVVGYTWFENDIQITPTIVSTDEYTQTIQVNTLGFNVYRVEVEVNASEGSTTYVVLDEVNVTLGNAVDVEAPADLFKCEDAENPGFAAFDLQPLVQEVLGTLDPTLFTVTFHVNVANANIGSNPIDISQLFTNTVPVQQQIFIRVTSIYSNNCFDVVSFTLNAISTLEPTFDPVSVCINAETVLPLTSLNDITGLWSGTGITPEGVVDTSVAGEFTFTFTPDAELFECAIPVDFTVTITATVVATFEPITTTYCVGVTPDALPLSNNSVSGTWSPSAIDTSVASGDEPFVYTFTPDAECNAVTTVLITVNAPTEPKFDTLPLTYCEGDEVSALPLFSDEGISGSWDIGTIDTSAPAVDVRYTFTPDFGQCASDFFIDVTITAKAPTTFNPVNPVCVGEALSLPTTSVEGTVGTWSGAGISPQGVVDTSVANNALVVTFTPTGCAEEQTVTIQIVARPAVDPGVDQIVCAADGAFILEPLTNGVYYSGPNGTGNVLTQVEVSDTPQTVYIFAAGTLAGCSSESSFTVTFITVEADELSDVEECGRYILPEIAVGNAYYTGPGATGTQLQAGQAIEEDQTIYIYASTGEGCFDQTSFEVVINNCDIQKGISPNGDGLNDFFDLTAYDVQKLSIYNRYGSKVYDRGNYSNEWYGQSSGGDELPDGTYYFVIEFNNIEAKSGWIYINRER